MAKTKFIRVNEQTRKRIKTEAARRGLSMGDYLDQLTDNFRMEKSKKRGSVWENII